MTGSRDEAGETDRNSANLDDLADAWIALWQVELTALAADPAVVAAWQQAIGLGTNLWRPVRAGAPDEQPAAAAPRSAAAGPASHPGPGDPLGSAAAAWLRARVDELERRLAALERGAAGSRTDRRKPRRRRPPG
ncbi:hypothetical protein [Dankookia sp. GCM10030260]|uniref:hypothetical protein n=1 Tax=Dankookia sp. GCM10030260 TaxID=3273390 RepID=UPI0036D2D944